MCSLLESGRIGRPSCASVSCGSMKSAVYPRCPMKIRVAAAFVWLAFPVVAQQRPAKPRDMSNMQHGGFMQEGMRHATAKGVKLAVKAEATTHTVTLRIGPMDLPANTSHMR